MNSAPDANAENEGLQKVNRGLSDAADGGKKRRPRRRLNHATALNHTAAPESYYGLESYYGPESCGNTLYQIRVLGAGKPQQVAGA